MSSENDICLWCQDSLEGQGAVMKLTTEEFKLMFKHDAACKMIHHACYQDYQEKRAKEISDDEQKRANGQSDPDLDRRPEPNPGRLERPHWWRILIAALSNQHDVHLGIQAMPRTTTNWLEPSELCNINRGQAMAQQVGMELYYQSNTPSFPRAGPIQPSQTLTMPMRYSSRSLPPQPTQHPSAPVQYLRPHEGWLLQPQGAQLQSAPTLHNRFALYNNHQGCFSGPLNSSHLADTLNHLPVQQNLYPVTYALPQQCSATYWSYSVTHTYNSAIYQSVHQERMQCHWLTQSPNAFGETYRV